MSMRKFCRRVTNKTQLLMINPAVEAGGWPAEVPKSQQQQVSSDNSQHSNKGESSASFLRAARAGNLDRVLELLRLGTDINTCNANGLNALHLASKEGHHEVVRELLKRKADVDAATKKGNTALHIASLAGQELIVTILVENDANVNVQSLNGFTPLYMAAQENHESVVRYLLAHSANQALATEDGFTPLAVALQQGHDRVVALLLENDTRGKVRLPALHIAAKKDDTKAATLLLQNEHNSDVTSKSGFTPLHIAAHYGNENVALLLLEKGANVNYQARHNISPLHVATKWGRANMVSLLLAHGAVIDCRTRDLLTPLHCASRSGHDQVVDLLLEKGAPINAKTKNGLAPLHMAAQGDHVDSARILLYHRAPVDDVTIDYLTPLHVAAHCGHVRVAKLLLDRNADSNARALNGFTPLHIACKKNRIKVVELLLKYHAAIEATTESGLSPLHVAAFMGAINIVIYLLQQGANANVATVRGETPLHLAARANQTDIVRVLVRNGAQVDAAARELQTPLHIASRLGNTDIVILLLQAGASPNAATRDLYTPLHIAAKEGQEEVAAILIDHGSDKTLLTKKGFTPLHLAAKYGNLPVAKLLLERGTLVDIEGKNQVTPLHVAAHYNNDKVALLLLESGASAHAVAKNGYTPLHIAAKKNQMDIASTLLHYRANANAESKAGFTPLHLSAQEGHREMAALLIENGAKVGAQARNGLTPMHLCAQEDRVNVAEELVKENAATDPKTKAGYTPLHVACHFGQINMVRFLIEHGAPVSATTRASYTPLHQAAQQGHNNVVRYLLEHGASPNVQTSTGQTPLSIAERLGYVSVVEALKTVTETTVITETTTITEERYKPQNPEAMNETMFSDSEDEGDDNQITANAHAHDFSESLTKGLHDSTGVHLIHATEPMLSRSPEVEGVDGDLDALIRKAQHEPVTTAMVDPSLDASLSDSVPAIRTTVQPSFLISFMVDARGGAMRGCRHSGVRIIIPPRKAPQPTRVTCRYLRKDKLAHPPPLSEGEALASRILEMAPHGVKFLGPVILEVPHFASLRGREREIVILRSDDGQHWKEHQLEATEDAVQEVLNESFDAEELSQLDDLHTSRITRILTNDFPMYFAVVTRVRQEVHCVGPEGGVILSSVVPRVQAIFPDGSLTKTIKVSVQAQPVPQEIVARLHGNRVAVSPIVTVEPRRRKFHKPITLCIPLPQSSNKGMLTQYSGQPGQEPPTLRLLCSITGGSAPAQWEDITGTTQLTFTGEDVSFTTTVSARFWLMDCQTPRDAARMAQEVYNEAISVPYMARFLIFARRTFPNEGQLRLFCMTDDREDKTLEKQEHFIEIAKSKDVEVLSGRHQFLEFSGNIFPITKSGDQLSLYFLPFQENRLAFMIKTRARTDNEAAADGRISFMKEPKMRAESLPPQTPLCTLAVTLPEYTGPISKKPFFSEALLTEKYTEALHETAEPEDLPLPHVARLIGADWHRLARALEVPDIDIRQVRHQLVGLEAITVLRIWMFLKKGQATPAILRSALQRIGRDDVVREISRVEKPDDLEGTPVSHISGPSVTISSMSLEADGRRHYPEVAATQQLTVEEPFFQQSEYYGIDGNTGGPKEQPFREEEEEVAVSEIRTVVRTERHVHDSEDGPIVEERTITTTYEDDVAVNEEIVDRIVPLNEEEQEKWDRMVREAEMNLEQQKEPKEGTLDSQVTHEEKKDGDDGVILKTTRMGSSHVSQFLPDEAKTAANETGLSSRDASIVMTPTGEEKVDHIGVREPSLSSTEPNIPTVTDQRHEAMAEGFTSEDGSVVVSKKMTRVVTTTRTTFPGEKTESNMGRLPSALDTIGSVKERIAIFETLSVDEKSVSTRKADNLSELAEVPKRERYSLFREGPSEPHDEPKIVPCKPGSDQFDTKEIDLVFADPLHGTDDTTGTEMEQLKTESRDLQKMGKLISNLTTEQLPMKEKETVRLSKEEITPQQMQESLIKIQGDVENLVMYQSEQSIICKGLRPVAGTEKIKEESQSKFYSITAAFEQPRSGSPKKKDFERVFYKSGAFLDYVQEYKDNIKDVEYSKTNSDADAEDRNELCVEEEQRWTDEKKLLKSAEETGTVAKEIILTPDTLTTFDTTKICDHDVKSDIRETPIEQLPDTDYLQLMPLITTRQYVEAAVMQGMVAEEGIIKKEIVYDPAKNLNEPVLKDEEERIGRITGSSAVETLDRERLINMNFQSSADQNSVFISSDMQMDTSFLEKISEKNCGNEVLIESVDENVQIGTFFKENMRKEVPENNEFQPMVPSTKSVEEGVTLKTGMAGSKERSLAELMTEEGTSYEVDLDGKSHLIMDHKSRVDERTKSSAEDKYPYELTVDISWALEEKDDPDAETEVEKQKSSYMEQVITYPSDDTLNVITEERVTGSIAKKCKDSSISFKLNGDSNKSSAKLESMKWEKLTDGFEMTSEKLKMKGLMGESVVKAEKVTFEHNKGFVIKIPRTDKEESESFFIHHFEPKEYHMKSSEIITAVESTTTQKWLGAEKESQEDLIIQRRQISELSRDEKLENVDAKALAMMNNQKEYEKRLITMEGDHELNEKAEIAQNLEKLKIYGSDGMMPQQPAGNDKKSCLLKRSSEQLITKHELMTSFQKGELERDISNKKITSSSCELSREEQRNIASEAFLDTIEICSIIPQQRKNVQIFAKESDRYQFTDFFLSDEKVQKEDKSLSYSEGPNRFSVIEKVTSVGKESFKDFFVSAEASRSGATSILEASGVSSVSRSLETVQVVEGQKSFPRSASFDVADNSMEKKREQKISHYEELEGHINASVISSAEAIVERNNAKVIYDEVTGTLWQQADGDASEKTFSRRQLELAAKEKSTVQLKNEQNITLSSAFDRYSAGQQNCQKFTLSRKKEVEKGASSSFFASVFLNYAEDTQMESLQKVEKRTKSLEETAVVPQKKIEEEIFINKLSHSVGEYLETKKDVYEIGSVRDSNNGGKMKTIAESTSEFAFEESLTLTKAPLARQNIGKGSFETDKETKITHVIDLEVNAGYLVGESKGKLGETVSRSNVSEQSNCSVNSSIGKHCSNKSPPSEERTAAEKSVPQAEHEHEADYECDLKKKLETFAEETRKLKRHVEGCNSLLKEYERNEEELNIQTTVMVDDVKAIESLSRSESTYKTATATSRDGYDTCLTSQEDTFETAPGYHSQESEYTTATSEASSRLSVMSDECRESATPIAILSPVQSDRLFTASQDEEQEPSRQESRVIDSGRSSRDVPDIELVSIEDEDDMGEGLLLTTSGILLAPDMDPGRPVSPVPPGFSDEDESIAVAIASNYSRKVVDQAGLAEIKVLDSIIEAPGDDALADQVFSSWKQEVPNFTTFQESVHEKAMDFEKECFPQYSYLSTENKTSIVHRIEEDEIADVALSSEAILYTESDSLDSLDKISVKSGSSGKKYSTSRRSSTISRKGSHDEPQTFLERLTPELKMSWIEKNQEVGSAKQTTLSLSDEYQMYMENGQVNPVEVELETLHEEPEEADSLNGRSASLNGQGTDISVTVGKYKTVSSDNVSETSLQEFERIERDVLNKGESSLSGSEAELYVAGKLKTADGSTSSLAEFERLEQEVIVEGSQQDEAMILSDIREESEVEEMSIRDDDEEEQDSISDIKAIPVEEDIQVATPLASPTDSIERDFENFVPEAMGTSIDSLEINAPPQSDLIGERYLTEYEVIEKVHEGMHDSLEIIPQDKDFMQKEVAMREVSKDRQTLLSDDTVSIYQDQEEKDSLAGDLDTVLHDYPTTLTTFETMQINEDGSTEIISRKVLTRVTDPVISHVQFTGTENEHRLRDLEREEQFETVDVEGNITRTTLHRSAPSSSAVLSTFEREELIALINHLKGELRKEEKRKNSCNAKSGWSRQKDTSPVYVHKLPPVKHEFKIPTKQMKTINKLIALSNETEEKSRAEITKIRAEDEAEKTTICTIKMTGSPKVGTPVEKSGPNANNWESDDSFARIVVGTKMENVTERPVSGKGDVSGQAEDESRVAEQKEHRSETIQRNWQKYENRENQISEHPVIKDNEDECKKVFDDVANSELIKESSNSYGEVQEWTEEEDSSSDTHEQLEKVASIKKIERQEKVKFESAERVEVKKEVILSLVSRSILRTTSAHLKRLELLIAKTNSHSSSP